ncbi:MAG: mRNA-capping enzyme subunit beta [Claussenomyces sp. TS43310]|nr:MAG: mRNA-capping enzyme subunit beta [Claussenomyces sp. TS43310]
MDLRSIINNEAGDGSARKKVVSSVPARSTSAQQNSREYNQPPPPSPTKVSSQDYGQPPYTSPTAYQRPYPGRPPAPPAIQAPPQNDFRSPASSSQYSGQSPFRQTPSSSTNPGQYPFPHTGNPQSPSSHPYGQPTQQRDQYPQSNQPPAQLQQQNSYGQPSTPQTPTVGTPGTGQTYFHQRSQSSHSMSTPTSAQSQSQQYHQQPADSPVAASPFAQTQIPQHYRQQSQPGTPLGPPISIPRQSSASYQQPTSPYQQRPPSSGAIPSQFGNPQVSPAQPIPATIPRQPSTPSAYGSHRSSLEDHHRRSQSEREQSLSVSPKTRVPSLPRGDMMMTQQQQQLENGHSSSSKRKVDDREVSEPTIGVTMAPGNQPSQTPVTSSPPPPSRKRVRYTEPPIWARSSIGRVKKMRASQVIKREVNGNQATKFIPSQVPAPVKAEMNGHSQVEGRSDIEDAILGPWEPSINGVQPYEEVSKFVADWLFMTVVTRQDAGELASRGVDIEIEAKLGQLIDQDTNQRIFLPVQTECVLTERKRVSFRSSMTEAQHKTLNDFLNAKVGETHPDNPNKSKPRVPVFYTHRRERDKFYELPPSLYSTLPASIRNELNPRHTVKVRVTHDQRTGQLLAKIIKSRVADMDIYMPRFPLDCRISVNLEMRYDGDVESLLGSTEGSRMPDRNKDRLSYKQSHYQIDLTQVTTADGGSRAEKEHELEIELSSAAVREQGRRALAGEPHKYAELIQGLMDNVRILTRTVPDHSATLG